MGLHTVGIIAPLLVALLQDPEQTAGFALLLPPSSCVSWALASLEQSSPALRAPPAPHQGLETFLRASLRLSLQCSQNLDEPLHFKQTRWYQTSRLSSGSALPKFDELISVR